MKQAAKSGKRNSFIKRRTPPGSTPGTLIVDPQAPQPVVTVTAYNATEHFSVTLDDYGQIPILQQQYAVVWVNIAGLGNLNVLQKLATIFAIHPLALEDVVNVHQRPKVDDYPQHHFIVARQVIYEQGLKLEQVSLFLGKGYVISFLEQPSSIFKLVHDRISYAHSRIRQVGADYLAYELLDAVIDTYYPVLEHYAEQLNTLEDEILLQPEQGLTNRIHMLKHELVCLKRSVWSQRDALMVLYRSQSNFIQPETTVFLRDCYDHSLQVLELLEASREHASNLMDIYLSSLNFRMNETMKVLTIISTIFMPIGVLASIWGMNFNSETSPLNMPELHWHFGYPMALGIMLLTAVSFLVYFWRKGWLGQEH